MRNRLAMGWRRALALWRMWALRHLPAGIVARGMDMFIGLICLTGGAGILVNIAEPPAAEQFLPDKIYSLWGITLLAGGLMIICGVMSIRWVRMPTIYVIRQLPCYRLGLRLLAAATALYAIAQVTMTGLNAVPAALLTFYFTVSCIARLLTLTDEEVA